MRRLNEFTAAEWLMAVPLAQVLRQWRNDALLRAYRRALPPGLDAFLAANRHLAGRDVGMVIAFEQPWALDWLLAMAGRNLPGITLLVFDNSRDAHLRTQIEEVCRRRGAPYLALPPYRTRHVNRSHGMAMSWVFHNVVRALAPRIFGFLDHDLVPVKTLDLAAKLDGQPVFGLRNAGNLQHWSLWAGYCFYSYRATEGREINFLYDFSRGLDTGGRNWNALYSELDAARLEFAGRELLELRLPDGGAPQELEFIDGAWLHIGGISYNDGLRGRLDFLRQLRAALDGGVTWDALVAQRRAAQASR